MQSANLYVYALNNPVRFIDPSGLWGRDVHYTATLSWAQQDSIGFTKAQAKIIANACNNVDFTLTSLPYIGSSWHVNKSAANEIDSRIAHSDKYLNMAIDTWNNATAAYEKNIASLNPNSLLYGIQKWFLDDLYNAQMNLALEYLGIGLHPLQDIDAHGNISSHKPGFLPFGLGDNHDKVAYDWDDLTTKLTVVDSGQTYGQRYYDTKAATESYFQRFLCGIGR
jgi:hypothetical protein